MWDFLSNWSKHLFGLRQPKHNNHIFILTEELSSVSLPSFTHNRNLTISDPINVVFRDIDLDETCNFLMLEGWKKANLIFGFASTQYIPFPTIVNMKAQDEQLVTGYFRRYHLRLWNITDILREFHNWDWNDNVIGCVHYDIPSLTGTHLVPDFESPKQDFASICKKNKKWIVHINKLDLGNRFANYSMPFNDGRAILIEKKKSGRNS